MLVLLCFPIGSATPAQAAGPSPTPEPDPLAVPVLPDNPSATDLGRVTYYYHCMPCHGDKGQGLTDEWRQVWVEDHQDCWARGCHGGRVEDQGFPIPRFVPPIMPPYTTLTDFSSVERLAAFLHTNHPPQSPGVLDETESLDLAMFLTQPTPQASTLEPVPSFEGAEATPAAAAGVVRAAVALAATLSLAWLIGLREPH
jgi:cytochrome c